MTEASEAALFEAVIVPHRSLSRRGLNILLIAIGTLCTINATIFIILGAWPVAGFTGIELFVAAVLFRINALASRGSELLFLTPSGLIIKRTSAKGVRSEVVLPPAWLQVVLEEKPSRISRLLLIWQGRHEEIARVLGEEEKRDLAQALEQALWRWRNPVFDNPQLRG